MVFRESRGVPMKIKRKLNNSNTGGNASPVLQHFLVGERLQTRIQQITGDANIEIRALANCGYTHFFIDEATYLEGFLNGAADWSDEYTPDHKIKIIIAGTDSFLLNIAKSTSLFHRYEQFQANWCSFAEFSRIKSNNYAQSRTQ
jgi:hypothetical protein